eukprot:scaffold368_cov127-Isochrysis_galbana.AAC.2
MARLAEQATAVQPVWQLSLTIDVASADKVCTFPRRVTARSKRGSPVDRSEASKIGAQLLHDEVTDVWWHQTERRCLGRPTGL